jgi:rod shape-determining protein MreD
MDLFYGPLMGEVLGFFWGLLSDSIGVNLFGMQSFLFSMAGFIAGGLRRRVAGERPGVQIVIALIATLFYCLGAAILNSLFEGGKGRLSFWSFLLEAFLNALAVTAIFAVSERWINLWKLEGEHV